MTWVYIYGHLGHLKIRDYAEEWENGNPCKDVFYSFKSKSSGIGLGTLIWLADREDPERGGLLKL